MPLLITINSKDYLLSECYNPPGSAYTKQFILTTRQILASLHFNENVHREVKKNKNGEVRTRVWWPKFKAGEAVVKEVKVEPTYSVIFFHKRLFMIINILTSYQVYHFLTPLPLPYCIIPFKLVQESD